MSAPRFLLTPPVPRSEPDTLIVHITEDGREHRFVGWMRQDGISVEAEYDGRSYVTVQAQMSKVIIRDPEFRPNANLTEIAEKGGAL